MWKQPVILKQALRGPKFELTDYAQYLADRNDSSLMKAEGQKGTRTGTSSSAMKTAAAKASSSTTSKELDPELIKWAGSMLGIEALRRTRKRTFDEIAELIEENVSVSQMRQWNAPLKFGMRNISQSSWKAEWAVRALRQIINAQDDGLMHCSMDLVRANDGTLEYVAKESVEKFKAEGKACLVWNQLASPGAELQA